MSNINKSPILIFGASGAIGSNAAHILKKNKYNLLLSNSKKNQDIKSLSEKLNSPYFSFNFDKKLSKKHLENKIKKHTSSLQGIIISIAKPFPNKLIQNTEDYIFEEQINIHLLSLHKIIRSCLPLLERAKNFCTPRITYISTEYLIGSPPMKIAPYVAAKSASTSYVKILAKELIKKDIRVFILSPGMIKSNLTSNIPEEYFKQIEQTMPEKKLTSTKEISNIINAIYKGYLDASYGNEIQVSKAERR